MTGVFLILDLIFAAIIISALITERKDFKKRWGYSTYEAYVKARKYNYAEWYRKQKELGNLSFECLYK